MWFTSVYTLCNHLTVRLWQLRLPFLGGVRSKFIWGWKSHRLFGIRCNPTSPSRLPSSPHADRLWSDPLLGSHRALLMRSLRCILPDRMGLLRILFSLPDDTPAEGRQSYLSLHFPQHQTDYSVNKHVLMGAWTVVNGFRCQLKILGYDFKESIDLIFSGQVNTREVV